MNRRYLAAGAIVVVVVLLAFLVVVKPKSAEVGSVHKDVVKAQGETESLQLRLRELQALAADQQQTQTELVALDQALPSTPDLVGLIRQLQSAATISGIDLTSIAPSPPGDLANATGVQTINVNLQVNGGFFRMETFLTRLESTLKRVIEVQSLAMSPTTDPLTGLTTLSSTMTFRMYVVQPNAHVSGPPPPSSATPTPTPRPTTSASPNPSPSPTST